jgi:hypothetical protein
LSRQQQLHPSLLRPLSAEQRRWLAALGISDATIARHGIAAQTVAHPLLRAVEGGDDGDGNGNTPTVDAVAIPYYQSGRLVDARYYVLAPAFRPEDHEGEDDTPAYEAAAGLVVAASWMARGGRALYVAGAGALGGSDALLRATGDVVVVGDELDALAVAEAFEQEQEEQEEEEGRDDQRQAPPPPPRPTVIAIPQPLPSWRRDAPLYADPRRRLYHLTQQLQRAREEEQRRRDREGLAPPATGAGRRRAEEERGGGDGGNGGNGGGNGGAMIDYLLPHASSVVFACRASAKGSHAAALNRQRQQWERRQREREQAEAASPPTNPAPDAALDGAAADEALAAEAARLFGEARCKTVQWPQAWTDHWERWEQGGGDKNDAADDDDRDGGLRCGALHMLLADGARALRLYVSNPREWPIAGLQRFFDYADEIYTAFGDLHDDENGDGSSSSSRRQPLAYSTGWPSLDDYYRVAPGEVTLVTGVPNSGKSEWLDALAVNLAEQHGWRFALCSMEKRASDHARQLLEKRARRPMLKGAAYATARGGMVPRMTEEELLAAFRWLDHHFVVLEAAGGGGSGDEDDGGGGGNSGGGGAPTLDWILDRARAAVAKYGVRGLIIDPYNEIDHASARFGNGGGRGGGGAPALLEHEHVASVMSSLRRFAQRHGVHVWLVAHPRQMPAWTGQAPTLMDVSGGANFMAKADNGVIVHRDWSRVAKELAARPDAVTVGGGGGGGGVASSGGRKSKAAAAAKSADEAATTEEAKAKANAAEERERQRAQVAEDELAARRANFGVRIILAKVRNKTSGQRGEAALEYDPVTGRYAEPSWFGGGGGGSGADVDDNDDAPPPWAGDPLSFVAAAAGFGAPSPQLNSEATDFAPPPSQEGGDDDAWPQQQQGAAPPPPERIPLSGGAYAEVSALDAAAAAAAYDALLEAQLDEWETGAGGAGGGGRVVEEVDWRFNTSGGGGGGGDDFSEPVDFDAWTFEP